MTSHITSLSSSSPSSVSVSMSSPTSLPVVIIGGGIAGLGAALALQNEGIPVQIYERDSSFEYRKQGYGMTLQAFQPLQELGVYKEVREADTASYEHWTFTPDGNIIGYFGRNIGTNITTTTTSSTSSNNVHTIQGSFIDNDRSNIVTASSSTGSNTTNVGVSSERGNVRIPREILRQILLKRLKSDTLHWGYKLCKFYETKDNTVKCFFEVVQHHPSHSDPSSEVSSQSHPNNPNYTKDTVTTTTNPNNNIIEIDAAVLIGADGIHSNVRKGLQNTEYTNTSNLSYLGVFLILGISPYQHYLLKNKGFYTLDGQRRLFTMPFTEADPHHPTYSIQPSIFNTTNNSNSDNNGNSSAPVSLTMWQLSFALENEKEAKELAKAKPSDLLARALKETLNWHEPVEDLLRTTIMDTTLQLWGTPLYDFGEEVPSIPGRLYTYYKDKPFVSNGNHHHQGKRPRNTDTSTDTVLSRTINVPSVNTTISIPTDKIFEDDAILPGRNYYVNPLVTLIGDAAHPMSPFKGQGANQALRDGPALAKWLKKAWNFNDYNNEKQDKLLPIETTEPLASDSENDTLPNPGKRKHKNYMKRGPRGTVSSAILSFEREMMVRAGAKVVASREAAQYFHSPEVLHEPQKIAGVNDEDVPILLEKIKEAKVGAWCRETILTEFGKVLTMYHRSKEKANIPISKINSKDM